MSRVSSGISSNSSIRQGVCHAKKIPQVGNIEIHFRGYPLAPRSPGRPKHFYYAKFNPGESFQSFKVAQVRKNFRRDKGCGPEGIQFLAITHLHFLDMMNERKIPFMALADYDVAPYGYNGFFDAPQLFCSNGIMGLVSEMWIVTIPSLGSLQFVSEI